MEQHKVVIELSREEALVLFDWISRFNKREDADFENQAERRVLWDIEAMLKSTLDEPFKPDYETLLAAARGKVRDSEE